MPRALRLLQQIDPHTIKNVRFGIDLGSYQTGISIDGDQHPVVIPSCVIFQKETKEVISIGDEAKEVIGRTSREVEVLNPVRFGIPTDPSLTSIFLDYCVQKVSKKKGRVIPFVGSTVFFLVSPNISEVQYRALEQTTRQARIGQAIYLVRPMISQLVLQTQQQGATVDVIIDCGYESTSFSILQLGKVSFFQKNMYGGKTLNAEIQSFLRHHHQIDVGLASCEKVKQECAKVLEIKKHSNSVKPGTQEKKHDATSDFYVVVRGRDILTSNPKTLKVAAEELRPLLEEFVDQILDDIARIIESLGPELMDDVIRRGIHLIGGMSVFTLLIQKIERQFGTVALTVERPDEVYHRGFLEFFHLPAREQRKYYFLPQWL